MDVFDQAKQSGDKWVVYAAGSKKVVRASADWKPVLPKKRDKCEYFDLGRGDDSDMCTNFRFRGTVCFYPATRLWQLAIVITNLDAWLDPEMAEDEFEMPGEDVCESSTYLLAELVTTEDDPYKAVQRMMRMYYAARRGRDWAILEEGRAYGARHEQVIEAFYEAEQEFLDGKR
jgi:hypothetical protein